LRAKAASTGWYATKGNLLFRMVENATANQLEKLLGDYLEKCHETSLASLVAMVVRWITWPYSHSEK